MDGPGQPADGRPGEPPNSLPRLLALLPPSPLLRVAAPRAAGPGLPVAFFFFSTGATLALRFGEAAPAATVAPTGRPSSRCWAGWHRSRRGLLS